MFTILWLFKNVTLKIYHLQKEFLNEEINISKRQTYTLISKEG